MTTFTALREDVSKYVERGRTADSDPTVYEQIPSLIRLGERRCAQALKIEGFINVVTSAMVAGTSVYAKPDRWRETVSFTLGMNNSGVRATASRSSAGTTRSLVTARPHGLAVGDSIIVAGVGVASYNSAAVTLTAAGVTSLSYTVGSSLTEASTADTGGRIVLAGSLNNRTPLLTRSYEFCRAYAPDEATRGIPVFYADYNFDNYLVAPTPELPYPWELVYYELPPLLSDATQTNWLTDNAPNLLLYASLYETAVFLKNNEQTALYKGLFDETLGMIGTEDIRRIQDRVATRKEA